MMSEARAGPAAPIPPGMLVGDRFVGTAELHRRAARVATGLKAIDIGPGDVVAVCAHNDHVHVEVLLAAQMIGAHFVPVNWHWRADETAYLLSDCGAKVFVAHADLMATLRAGIPAGVVRLSVPTPPEVGSEDGTPVVGTIDYPSWRDALEPLPEAATGLGSSIFYTSGTTGRPKGVVRLPADDRQAAVRRAAIDLCFGVRPHLRYLVTGPLYHLFCQSSTMASLHAEGTAVVMPRFDPERLLQLVEQYAITHIQMVPTMFVRLLRLPIDVRARYDLSSLEFVVHSAAPCAPEVKRRMIAWFGPIIYENYGSTETTTVTQASADEWLARPGTVGKAFLDGEIRIRGDSGEFVGPGEVGDVYLRLHGISDFTYLNDAAKRASVGHDGLVTIGDIGWLDDDGFLFLCDRRTDMVISGGVNIYPAEIEAVLLQHPAVRDVAVFGVPDDDLGEAVIAHVDADPVTAEELHAFVRDRLAAYKVPKRFVFQSDLPREDSGKVFKRRLRDPYWQGRQTLI